MKSMFYLILIQNLKDLRLYTKRQESIVTFLHDLYAFVESDGKARSLMDKTLTCRISK
jgi:hypothetical protein